MTEGDGEVGAVVICWCEFPSVSVDCMSIAVDFYGISEMSWWRRVHVVLCE